jgi:hypothetical protein
MKIKKFEFSINGFFRDSYSLKYKKGIFEYRADVFKRQITTINPVFKNDYHFENVAIFSMDSLDADLIISEERKNNFYKYITKYCKSWETEYQNYEVYDGTGWECTIWIDDFKLVSRGYEAYPNNFKAFMNKLKILTSGKIFK